VEKFAGFEFFADKKENGLNGWGESDEIIFHNGNSYILTKIYILPNMYKYHQYILLSCIMYFW
jgi:hypothetical protein